MLRFVKAGKTRNWFVSDQEFDSLYPWRIRLLAKRHWTPLSVCKLAAEYLANRPGARVLDIGSGVGKFCLAASHYKPHAFFSGIEQREQLVSQAVEARSTLKNYRVDFIHGNFTQVDFQQFDAFYFYNSFYENLVCSDRIDESIAYSLELYEYYSRQLYCKLDEMPEHTKLVTFHSLEDEIPPSYDLEMVSDDRLLKFWRKINV